MSSIRTRILAFVTLAASLSFCPNAQGDDWGGPALSHACGSCGCGAPKCQTCILAPDVKKVTKPAYGCRAINYCLTTRPLLDLFRGLGAKPCGCCAGDGPCGCGVAPPQCECHVRRKMVLMKKIVTVECPTFKCQPVCCPPAGCAGQACFDGR